MKLVFFDDFKLGVVEGDRVVDVSDVVADIPHISPHHLINGLIERFDGLQAQDRGGCRGFRWRASGRRPTETADSQARKARVHGRQLHGRRHPGRARSYQRFSEVAEGRRQRRGHRRAVQGARDDLRA